jgi:hypothetical protein
MILYKSARYGIQHTTQQIDTAQNIEFGLSTEGAVVRETDRIVISDESLSANRTISKNNRDSASSTV